MNYNGWTNYSTWRVNLEMIDGLDLREMGWKRLDKYDLADALKEYVVEVLSDGCKHEGLVFDYAMAFISDVNWREIAESMIENYDLYQEQEEDA
jgi:hypothetical protein